MIGKNGSSFVIDSARSSPLDRPKNFWGLIQTFALELLEAGSLEESFGSTMSRTMLPLQSGLFPNLVNEFGQLNTDIGSGKNVFEAPTLSEAKYKKLLVLLQKGINEVRTKLESNIKKKSRDSPLTKEHLYGTTFGHAFKEGSDIKLTDQDFANMAQNLSRTLAESAELTRRELVTMAVTIGEVSNHAQGHPNELHILTHTIKDLLAKYTMIKMPALPKGEAPLQPGTGTAADTATVATGTTAADIITASMTTAGTTATSKKTTPPPLCLPDLFVRTIVPGHLCLCPACDPSYKEGVRFAMKEEAELELAVTVSDDAR